MLKTKDAMLYFSWVLLFMVIVVFVNLLVFLVDITKYSRIISKEIQMRSLSQETSLKWNVFSSDLIKIIDKETMSLLVKNEARFNDNIDSLKATFAMKGNINNICLHLISTKKFPLICVVSYVKWSGMDSSLSLNKTYFYVFTFWIEISFLRVVAIS